MTSGTILFTEMNPSQIASDYYNNFNIWKYADLPYDNGGNATFNGRMMNTRNNIHLKMVTASHFDGHASLLNLKDSTDFSYQLLDGLND